MIRIYAIFVAGGKRTLLFSDEGPHLELLAAGAATSGNKAYLLGFWREWRGQPSPGVQEERAYYEMNLDGSNQFHRIADAQAGQGPATVNPQGTKAVVRGANERFFVYSVPDWKLLATWDLSGITRAHCPACTPVSCGWLADGDRLYFNLEVVGEETDEEAKANHPGTHILSESGTDLGVIPPQTGAFQFPGYVHAKFTDRQFLGQSMDGRYLFLDYRVKEEGTQISKTAPFLVISNSNPTLHRNVPLKFPVGGAVSPSGRYMAYLELRQRPDYRSETHLWVKDLESGEDKELFASPPPNPPTSTEPNEVLSLLGWIEK